MAKVRSKAQSIKSRPGYAGQSAPTPGGMGSGKLRARLQNLRKR